MKTQITKLIKELKEQDMSQSEMIEIIVGKVLAKNTMVEDEGKLRDTIKSLL